MSVDRTKIRWNGWGWAAHREDAPSGEAVWAWLAEQLGMPALLATPPRALADISLPQPALTAGQRDGLAAIVGPDHVRDDAFERAFHALGRSYHDLIRLRGGTFRAPDAVVYPRGGAEVLEILRFASDQGIAVVPFGGGTGVVGGASAELGSFPSIIALDMSGMDRLIDLDALSGTAVAEAGITGPLLERNLAARGFTLGHNPQSFEFSTLGGWIAHRGAGEDSDRVGSARDWLVGARVATPQGWLETGPAPASAAGPDLNGLILGSEGVLGVVTEATIRVRALPARRAKRLYLFRDFPSGIAAIRSAAREAVPVTLRLSDAGETRFHRRLAAFGSKRGIVSRLRELALKLDRFDENAAALVAGFAGSEAEIASAQKRMDTLAARLGARALGEGPAGPWAEMREKAPYWRDQALDRGLGIDTFETAASWSKLPALYAATRGALESALRENAPRPGARGIVLCHIGHSYQDGASLYFTVLFARALADETGQWRAINRAALDAIRAHGGTLSHHHGVGEDRLDWIAGEKGALGIEILRAVKRAVDPRGILNPGKLIPPA